jgi:hypothetical protein
MKSLLHVKFALVNLVLGAGGDIDRTNVVQALLQSNPVEGTMAKFHVTTVSCGMSFARFVLETLRLCGLITVPIGLVLWSSGSVRSSSCFVSAVTHSGSRVFVAIFSSNFTIARLIHMESSILNNTLFDTDFLDVVVVLPRGHGPIPGKQRFLIAPCPTDVRHGLCCRLDSAMRLFLRESTPWFLRAIDDSWFNPDNLH